MKLKWLRPTAAGLFLLLIVLHPADALQAAVEALQSWALSVAPALLPFLMVTPALICEETTRLFKRAAGGCLRIMRCPEETAGAILVGILGGSPAGAAALSRIAWNDAPSSGGLLRAALLASGASPAFLMSGIAVGMLNAPETGWLLVRSQLIGIWGAGLLMRQAKDGQASLPAGSTAEKRGAALETALTLLTIGGYMALFSVLARLLAGLMGAGLETPILAVMELAGGCGALARLPLPMDVRLPLISAAACFGGISVCAQCLSFLRPMGISSAHYVLGKLLQALLAGLATLLQLHLTTPDPLTTSLALVCLPLLYVMLRTLADWHASSNASAHPIGQEKATP